MVERRSPKPDVASSSLAWPADFKKTSNILLLEVIMKKIIEFFKECYGELKKVNWPTRDDVVSQTIIVVVSLIIVSAALAVIDLLSFNIIEKIITIGK